MTTLPVAAFLTALFTGIAVSAQFLIKKTLHHNLLQEHHGIIDPLLGVVGTLFSVLLGFLVAGSMDRYHDACTTVDLEANATADVFRLARGLNKTDRLRLRGLCREYVNVVLDDEWKQMERQQISETAQETYQKMWEAILSIEPATDSRIGNIQQCLLDSMQHIGENRRLRVVASQHNLSAVQWFVIGLGAAITVLFTLFFPMKKVSFQIFLTMLVTVSLGLNVWLMAAYSMPFAGELRIHPYMFELLRTQTFTAPDGPPRFLNAADLRKDNDSNMKMKVGE